MPTQTFSLSVAPNNQQPTSQPDSLPETSKINSLFSPTRKLISSEKALGAAFQGITINDCINTGYRWDSVIECGVKDKSGSGKFLEYTGGHTEVSATILGVGLSAMALLGFQGYRKLKSQEWNQDPNNLISLLDLKEPKDKEKLNKWIKEIFAKNPGRFQYLSDLEFGTKNNGLTFKLTNKWPKPDEEKTTTERLISVGGVLKNCVDIPGTLFWLMMINTAIISGTLGTLYNLGPVPATIILGALLLCDLVYVGLKLTNYYLSKVDKEAQITREEKQKGLFESLTQTQMDKSDTAEEKSTILETDVLLDSSEKKTNDKQKLLEKEELVLTQAHKAEFLSLLRSLIFRQQYEKASTALTNKTVQNQSQSEDKTGQDQPKSEDPKKSLTHMTGIHQLDSKTRSALQATVVVLGAGLSAFNIQQFALFPAEWYSGVMGGPGGASTFGGRIDIGLASAIVAVTLLYMVYNAVETHEAHTKNQALKQEVELQKTVAAPLSDSNISTATDSKSESESESKTTLPSNAASEKAKLFKEMETQYQKLLTLKAEETNLLAGLNNNKRAEALGTLNQIRIPDFFDPLAFEDARKVSRDIDERKQGKWDDPKTWPKACYDAIEWAYTYVMDGDKLRSTRKNIKRLYMGILGAESAMMLLRFCVVPSTGGIWPGFQSIPFPGSQGLGLSFTNAFMITAICATILWGLSKMALHHTTRNDDRAKLFLEQLPERAYALNLQVAHYEKRVQYLGSLQSQNQALDTAVSEADPLLAGASSSQQ